MRVLWFLALLASGCTPSLTDGRYACSGPDECPPGYTCAGGRCRTGTGSECRYSFDCARPCSDAACVNGYCQFTPIAELEGQPCEDGLFCNGENLCRGGVCQPQGAPCDGCTEELGCSACGVLGSECCPSDFCFDGECVLGTCRACGDEVEGRCCPGQTCGEGLTCLDDGLGMRSRCISCGLKEQPCCFASRVPALCAPGLGCAPAPVEGGFGCVTCGGAGQPCCDDGCDEGICTQDNAGTGLFVCEVSVCPEPCGAGEVCVPGDFCLPCGVPDGPCCPGEPFCDDGTACMGGYCPGAVMPGVR
jgi:hypothetical protein